MASLVNFTKHQRRVNTNFSQTLPKKSKRREHSQTHFMRPALSGYQNQKKDTTRKQNKTKPKKLPVNILDEYRDKNSQ